MLFHLITDIVRWLRDGWEKFRMWIGGVETLMGDGELTRPHRYVYVTN